MLAAVKAIGTGCYRDEAIIAKLLVDNMKFASEFIRVNRGSAEPDALHKRINAMRLEIVRYMAASCELNRISYRSHRRLPKRRI